MLVRIFASMVLLGATVTPSVAQRFRGYTGRLRAIGFPNRLSCDPDGEVGGKRIEDATRRGIDIDPIAPRADQYNVINIGPCKDKPFPLHQVMRGLNHLLFVEGKLSRWRTSGKHST